MGRIQRFTMTEDVVYQVDFGMPTPGKLAIHPVSFDIRVAYDRADASSTTGVQYFTLFAGTQYWFDLSPGVGWLAQNQGMFINSPDGVTVVEIWIANDN
tara:strand:- start:269 stop:565 length:297 start_codon:yes stop_codon:yes gene_type:complete